MFNESMHDFYKNQTFYKAAKLYAPELKKQIISFLRKKGIEGYKSYKLDIDLIYNDLPPKEDRRKLFHDLYSIINITDRSPGDKTRLPTFKEISISKFIYNNFEIDTTIRNNETFFDDGHDLLIYINTIDGNYETKRNFNFKLNLLRNINIVLEDFWSLILKSIEEFPLTEKPQNLQNIKYRQPISPEPDIIIKKWLDTYYKEYKSGKKIEIDDATKQPAEFFIIKRDKEKKFNSNNQNENGFTLKFKIRLLSRNFDKSGYSTKLNPELKARYPRYEEWIKIYNKFIDDMGLRSYHYIDDEKFFGEKSYSDEHIKIFEKLKIVIKRLYNMGYYPTSSRKAYSRDDYAEIEFYYDPQIPEKLRLNPAKINTFLSSKKYKDIIDTFFYAGKHPNDVLHNLLKTIFSINKAQ